MSQYFLTDPFITPAWDLVGAPLPQFEFMSVGVTTGRYVDFQFSAIAVPEPSGMSFLLVGGCTLLLRRPRPQT